MRRRLGYWQRVCAEGRRCVTGSRRNRITWSTLYRPAVQAGIITREDTILHLFLSWLLFFEWPCLIRGWHWISHISCGARLNVIKVGNHLQQIYKSLLIASLTPNITVTNCCISESSYRRLTLPCYLPCSPPSNPFQKLHRCRRRCCRWPECVTPNKACRKFSLSICVKAHSSAITLYLSCPSSFTFHHREGLTLPRGLRSSIPPPGHPL